MQPADEFAIEERPRFAVLGSLQVFGSDGGPVRLPSVAQRRLTSILILRAGTVVSSDLLGERLDLSPGALRTSVSRLRRVIGETTLVTAPPGYELRTDDVDSKRFERLLAQARGEVDPARSREKLEAALALWRGEAYVEFAHEEWAVAEATRLAELRAGANESLVDLLIETQDWTSAIAHLEILIAEHPYRDYPRGQMMRALALSGRRTDALRSFQDYRSFLIDELGTEPSAAVVALDREIAQGLGILTERTPPQTRNTVRPTGIVTFLFTDIEGSTRLWHDHPVEMNYALARHHELLLSIFGDHGGSVFASGGDGFATAFSDPIDAMRAAAAAQLALVAQEWPAPLRLRVRMGLHSGLAFERDGDYFGPTLNTASRIMSAGHGQQILMSATTVSLIRDDLLPPDMALRSHGLQQLVDIAEPIELFELFVENLDPTGLPPRSRSLAPSTLPVLRSTLVGRTGELDRLVKGLGSHRLMTIVGAAGCGKSALALRAAHRAVGMHGDGVFHVDLGSAEAAGTLVSTIAREVKIEPGTVTTLAAFASELEHRRVLLVLDNCEHVADEVAELVDALLDVEGPSVLVTSRLRLGVEGEVVIPLGPMSSLDNTGVSEAVRLFVDRANAVGVVLDTSVEGLKEIEELCARMDHLPFAVELAAANTVNFSPHQLLMDLDFDRVGSTLRRSKRRWLTIDDMIDWSYQLLDPIAQALLRGFAPFRGAVGLDPIRAVWAPTANASMTTSALESLVSMNLVVAEPVGREFSYRLLETVRRSAAKYAQQSGELPSLQLRHREWYLQLAESVEVADRYASSRHALACEKQIDNFRAALENSVAVGDVDMVVRQTEALTSLWWMLGYADEGLKYLDAARSPASEATLSFRLTEIVIAFATQNWHKFDSLREGLMQLASTCTDELAALALGFLGASEWADTNRGIELVDDALQQLTSTNPLCELLLNNFAGEILLVSGRFQEASERYGRTQRLSAGGLDPWWEAASLANGAIGELLRGNNELGLRLALASMECARTQGTSGAISRSVSVLSVAYAVNKRIDEAVDLLLLEIDRMQSTTRMESRLGLPLGAAAFVLLRCGRPGDARALLAYLVRERLNVSAPWQALICVLAQQELGAHDPAPSQILTGATAADFASHCLRALAPAT